MRIAKAVLRLAQGDPHAATAALAPVLDGSAPVPVRHSRVQSFVLEAIARDALGDPGAADRALKRALDLAEPDGILLPAVPRAGAARAPCPWAHRARFAARRDPQPAGHLYGKLGTHRRGQAVTRARALSLLAPAGPGLAGAGLR